MAPTKLEKIEAFIECVEKHFLITAMSEGVSASCTATCLLLFSAADAIGAAFCPVSKPSNRQRFEWAFSEIGEPYRQPLKELWELRNNLVHEALNASAFLSQVPDWGHDHLDLTQDGKLLLNTRDFTRDFRSLIQNLKSEIQNCSSRAIEADDRLEWAEALIDQRSPTTAPAPICFGYLKRR